MATIDRASRSVTLSRSDGDTFTVQAGPDAVKALVLGKFLMIGAAAGGGTVARGVFRSRLAEKLAGCLVVLLVLLPLVAVIEFRRLVGAETLSRLLHPRTSSDELEE